MSRTLPLLALVAVVALAGCTGGLGLGGSSDDPTTTTPTSTETTQTPTSTPSTTTTETTTTTTPQTTTATQTTSTTTATATQETTTTQATAQATTIPTRTTARVDAPKGSDRFEARVTKIVDPTTIEIEHDGTTQTVDLIGVRVPKNGTVHKRALQTTKSQLDYSIVTIVTDPKIERTDSDGHLQAYVYTGNWLYNTQLLRTGYARVADGEFSKRAEFEQKQQEAKQGGYGLWNTTTTTT